MLNFLIMMILFLMNVQASDEGQRNELPTPSSKADLDFTSEDFEF